ncbi:MAG: ArsR family transcriptional regulator [Acidobacteria bacterium]|nr:ArsR family transcriptional regulator [Acidobacteriota bacterium]
MSTADFAARAAALTPLHDVRVMFRRWLGDDYDLDAVYAVLATAAAEKLAGDPLWLLLVSGSGNAKTETVSALSGIGATVVSTITSDGALLSGSPSREKTKESTGGLLRAIGNRGVLVIKDVTSVLSMNRDTRGAVLAALREVHDGHWTRHVGTDGGRTLSWQGRIAIVGAVTTAWDRAHDVIASMGDRFVILRMDSSQGRILAGRQAIANTGHEEQMRADLSGAAAAVLAAVQPSQAITLTAAETERLLQAADVVTLARTGVDYDYRGDVIDAHAPEAPTRFAKQLAQMLRGAVAIGLDRPAALRLALRCARDSMPPLRLAILDDVAANPGTLTKDVRRRLAKPRATVDRQLQSLHMLGVLACDEEEGTHRGHDVTLWRYRLAEGIDTDALNPDSVPDLSVSKVLGSREREQVLNRGSDISGTGFDGRAFVGADGRPTRRPS